LHAVGLLLVRPLIVAVPVPSSCLEVAQVESVQQQQQQQQQQQ